MTIRKTITETIDEISPWDFSASLGDVKENLERLIKQHGVGAILYWQADHHYAYDSNPSPIFLLRKERAETDKEFDDRVASEKRLAADILQREQEEFERLSKKFGKK